MRECLIIMARKETKYKVTILPMTKREKENYEEMVTNEVAKFILNMLPEEMIKELLNEVNIVLSKK